MNLTIDRGNSSTKLTLWDDGRAADAVTVADLTRSLQRSEFEKAAHAFSRFLRG